MIRALGFLALLPALMACTPPDGALRQIVLDDDTLVARAPRGYCLDERSSAPQDGFALMAPCATLGVAVPPPAFVGLLSVQSGGADSAAIVDDPDDLRDLLDSDDGRKMLSGRGQADDIGIIATASRAGQVTVHFTDNGPPPLAGLQDTEWRGFVWIGDRLVTVGLRGLAAAPLDRGDGVRLLQQALSRLGPVLEGATAVLTPNDS